MKRFVLFGLVSILVVTGALAHQPDEQMESSGWGMMQQMMGGEKVGNGMSGMEGMMGMMGRMNEMMERCSAMMDSEETKGDQKGVEKE